jgi:GTP-binding protein
MVDLASLDGRDPVEDWRRINEELASFNPGLAERPQIVVGNKIDVASDEAVSGARERFVAVGVDLLPVSVATRAGLQDLVARTYRAVESLKREDGNGVALPVRRKVYRFRGETGFRVEREDEGFVVIGDEVEKLVRKLVLDSRDAMEYLSDRLEKMGVMKELRKRGFTANDAVRIGEAEFELEG